MRGPFPDGRGDQKHLRLTGCPVFLRVMVHKVTGEITALDKIGDKTIPQGDVFVYEKSYTENAYCLYAQDQPDGRIIRDNTKWQEWATERMKER